jgi:cystathionine beta-lyase
MNDDGFDTLCAHLGEDPAKWFGAAAPPILQASLFTSPTVADFLSRTDRHPELYDYTRVSNPTTDILETKLAALERCESARVFSSGMAAVSAAVLSCVRSGDHIVAVDTIYGPSRMFLSKWLHRFGVEVTYVGGEDPEDFPRASRENTRLYYLESPSSAVFRIQDLAAVAASARAQGIRTIIDNSWASPYFQNPADFGIDLVLHSATKYLGGHSDILAGAVMGPKPLLDRIKLNEGALLGAVLDPFASWLMIRALRTLSLRMERHYTSATAVAHYLSTHPAVHTVYYPGLPAHPGHALAMRQMRGCSGLLSFTLHRGDLETAAAVIDRLRLFGIGVSWGGYESLAVPIGISDDRIYAGHVPNVAEQEGVRFGARLHIGLENIDDVLADLEQALQAAL